MKAKNDGVWLSTKEAAAELGIELRTAYGLINSGSLKARKFGRVIRIRRVDLEEFLELSVIEPGGLAHLVPPAKGGES